MVDVTEIEILSGRTVRLQFSDNSERTVDLTLFLWGPVFEELANDDDEFRKVRVDPERGTISWPNGADIDPLVLHGDYDPARRQTEAPA